MEPPPAGRHEGPDGDGAAELAEEAEAVDLRGAEGQGFLQDNRTWSRVVQLQAERQIAGEQPEAEGGAIDLDAEAFGTEMFETSSDVSGLSAEEIVGRDAKEYAVGDEGT